MESAQQPHYDFISQLQYTFNVTESIWLTGAHCRVWWVSDKERFKQGKISLYKYASPADDLFLATTTPEFRKRVLNAEF